MVFGGAKSSKSLVQVKQAVDMQVIVYVFREISSLFITIIHMYASTRAYLIHPCAGSKYFIEVSCGTFTSNGFVIVPLGILLAWRVVFELRRLEKLKAQVLAENVVLSSGSSKLKT